jgi:hypothetical protein
MSISNLDISCFALDNRVIHVIGPGAREGEKYHFQQHQIKKFINPCFPSQILLILSLSNVLLNKPSMYSSLKKIVSIRKNTGGLNKLTSL